MFPSNIQSPSFYRNHPYKNQFDLPNSAFKNRQAPNYYSQIPAGRQFFEPTNKKHFQNKFNRSEIEQDNVFQTPYTQQDFQKSRIAMNKSYFRSLNVQDIQGAKPNTLISKAVKNRQKALSLQKHEDKHVIINQNRSNIYSRGNNYEQQVNRRIAQNNSGVNVQQEAINKYQKNKSILQNNSFSVLNNNFENYKLNQNIQQEMNRSPSQSGGSGRVSQNYHFKNNQPNKNIAYPPQESINYVQRQLQQKQRRIRQLQKQLQVKQNYFNKANEQDKIRNQRKINLNLQSKEISLPSRNNYQQIKKDAYEKMGNHQLRINKQYQYRQINNEQNYYPNSQSQPIAKQSINYQPYENIPSTQMYRNAEYTNPPNCQRQSYDKQSSSSRNNKRNIQGSQNITNLKNIPNLNNVNIYQELPYKIDKNNARKFNPTFLSFQSEGPKSSILPNFKNGQIY